MLQMKNISSNYDIYDIYRIEVHAYRLLDVGIRIYFLDDFGFMRMSKYR